MARDKKTATDLRTTFVKLSLSAEEHAELERAAVAAGAPLAVWIRMVALREARG